MMTAEKMLEKALSHIGGRDEYERKRKQYSDNLTFFENNFSNWINKYNNEWIGIYDSQLVGHSRAYGDLERILTEEKKLPLDEVVIKYLTKRKVATLF
jgi:hypothetical protein